MELNSIAQPTALVNLLDDVQPTNTTVIVVNKHVFIDKYPYITKDNSTAQYEMVVGIKTQYGQGQETTAENVVVPAYTSTVLVQANIIDPNLPSSYPYTWEWSSTGTVNLITPYGPSTRINNLSANTTYEVTLVVTNGLQQKRVAKITIATTL
jgi:hypothetical protein